MNYNVDTDQLAYSIDNQFYKREYLVHSIPHDKFE